MTEFIFKASKITDSPYFQSHPVEFTRGRTAGTEAAETFVESKKRERDDVLDTTQLEAFAAELAGRSEGHADYVIWLMQTVDQIYRDNAPLEEKGAA